ncbi:DNA-binding IclR family transcriptional regulator [Sphingomonas vulcanisoli]|uniref:DNA-binding IclR family transcriptional regulator n=1 Tax=Sphingomonas vulcanisoli TaxID=1658060 RepID=A0ABX0TSJ3_9SPHN|nr:IclR family transcriptional regulator [Sphingomonas vulcanisoli]NIJ08497.1 DNA-binding IclR family transcriptional regulator [Sphingomonas vulcanisoli]
MPNKADRALEPSPSGTQTFDRAMTILRLVAEQDAAGLRLVDAVRQLQLNKATTHRLLLALMREGLIAQDPDTKTYRLGFELFALGMAASRRFNIKDMCEPSLLRLAEQTGETIYLSVRSGHDAVCLARETGSNPIQTLTLAVGDRRPLGVGAGSLALLAALEADQIEQAIIANQDRVQRYSPVFSADLLRQLVTETRRRGYSLNDGAITAGMKAVGVPIFNRYRHVEAALSIAAVDAHMKPDRQEVLVGLLREECARIEKSWSANA